METDGEEVEEDRFEGIAVLSERGDDSIILPVVNIDRIIYLCHAVTKWFKEAGYAVSEIKWLQNVGDWFRLMDDCAGHTGQALSVLVRLKRSSEAYHMPLWLADDGLLDFLSRIDKVLPCIDATLSNYEKYCSVRMIEYETFDNKIPFSILLPQWVEHRSDYAIPLYRLLDKLYVPKDEFEVDKQDAKFALVQMFSIVYPELANAYTLTSPRCAPKIKLRAQAQIQILSTVAFAHLCIYFCTVDKRMLIWLFQHVVRCDPLGYQNFLLSNVKWMQNCPEMLTYFQITAVIENNSILLRKLDAFICQWRLGTDSIIFNSRNLRADSGNPFVRSHSESEVTTEDAGGFASLTASTPLPVDLYKRISHSAPPSARGPKSRDHYYPFVGIGIYAKLLYMASRFESDACLEYLKSTYYELYQPLLESEVTLDKLDADLPPQTLSDLLYPPK